MRASEGVRGRRSLWDDDQSAAGDSCFLPNEQSWRTAWRARSLPGRTNGSSRCNPTPAEAPLLLWQAAGVSTHAGHAPAGTSSGHGTPLVESHAPHRHQIACSATARTATRLALKSSPALLVVVRSGHEIGGLRGSRSARQSRRRSLGCRGTGKRLTRPRARVDPQQFAAGRRGDPGRASQRR
jgi:hypothetical protein